MKYSIEYSNTRVNERSKCERNKNYRLFVRMRSLQCLPHRGSFQLRQVINMLHQLSKSSPMQIQEIGAAIAFKRISLNEITLSCYGTDTAHYASNILPLFAPRKSRAISRGVSVSARIADEISPLGFAHSYAASHLVRLTYVRLF